MALILETMVFMNKYSPKNIIKNLIKAKKMISNFTTRDDCKK